MSVCGCVGDGFYRVYGVASYWVLHDSIALPIVSLIVHSFSSVAPLLSGPFAHLENEDEEKVLFQTVCKERFILFDTIQCSRP